MNGAAALAFMAVGAVIAYVFTKLRHGGVLDLQQCLAFGHQRPTVDGHCPRCQRRVFTVVS